jgi:hypothetical protein
MPDSRTRFLYFVVLLCSVLPGSGGLAEEKIVESEKSRLSKKLESYYPTVQEIYGICKEDLQKDPKSFLLSYCSGRIAGLMEGELLAYSQLSAEEQWKVVSRDREGKKDSTKICIPFDSFPQDIPLEQSIAKDFVLYIDTIQKKGTKTPLGEIKDFPNALLFARFFSEVYACKQASNGAKQ